MTKTQKIQLAMSEKRQRLNELLGIEIEERSESQQAEFSKLTGEIQKLEPELRAAIAAEPDPVVETRVSGDAADVELRSLIHDASPGRILSAVHSRRNTDGREAELQAHFKVAGNELPHAMLETRAQTQAPTNVATQQAEIIQPIFGMTGAAFLNIPMPSVAPGAATYPIISSRPAPETPAEGVTVTADIPAGSFEADLLKPQAAQTQIEFSREDAASFPSMSDALGRVIVDSVGFELDRQMLRHTTEGLLTAGLTAPGNPGGVSAFADYRKALNDQVNGREAGTAADCRILIGSATYSHSDTQFRGNQSEVSALDYLHGEVGRGSCAYRRAGRGSETAGCRDRQGARPPARGDAGVVVSATRDRRDHEATKAPHRLDRDSVVRVQGASHGRLCPCEIPARRVRAPCETPCSTSCPLKCGTRPMVRCCAAWCYRRGARHTAGGLKSLRRCPSCGRRTGSRSGQSIEALRLGAPCRHGTPMDRFALRHAQPRPSSPPTKHAATSLSSFTRWQRSARRAESERYHARC